jgi:hypothetical protein
MGVIYMMSMIFFMPITFITKITVQDNHLQKYTCLATHGGRLRFTNTLRNSRFGKGLGYNELRRMFMATDVPA